MRFKKAPFRTGMERVQGVCSSTSTLVDQATHQDKLQRVPRVEQGQAQAAQPSPLTMDSYMAGMKDEETQAAQAKLRQYEALGLIKVEVEETPEEVEQSPPSSKVEPSQHHTNSTMVMTSVPVPVTTNTLPKLQQSSHIAPVMGTVDVPVLNDNEGEYGFTVTVEDKERTMKSPMWLMSRITNKLYTNINKAVPFEIHLKKPIKNQMFSIRAVPVFSSPQFLRHNVNRCPNHAAPTDSTNHDFPYPEHVVRADHPEARYIKSASGRLSVVVPVDPLQDGSDYTPILLRFMCLGSCVGGINRRPIAIILTLENSSGKECGRKVIDVRVCACPTRDIKTDEQAILYKGGKRKASVMQQEKVPLVTRKKPRAVDPKTEPQEEDKMFLIPVRGQKLYNFLMDMKAVYYRNHPEYAAKYPDDDINRLLEA